MIFLHPRFAALYRFAALVALLSMLVPLATGVLHHPEMESFLSRICGAAKADQGKKPAQKTPVCSICLSLNLAGNGFAPPESPVLLRSLVLVVGIVGASAAFLLLSFFTPQTQPRAPPLSLV